MCTYDQHLDTARVELQALLDYANDRMAETIDSEHDHRVGVMWKQRGDAIRRAIGNVNAIPGIGSVLVEPTAADDEHSGSRRVEILERDAPHLIAPTMTAEEHAAGTLETAGRTIAAVLADLVAVGVVEGARSLIGDELAAGLDHINAAISALREGGQS